jgi:hypothetical protein
VQRWPAQALRFLFLLLAKSARNSSKLQFKLQIDRLVPTYALNHMAECWHTNLKDRILEIGLTGITRQYKASKTNEKTVKPNAFLSLPAFRIIARILAWSS